MQLAFDATTVTPSGDRTAVPKGRYRVILKSSEIKPTQDQKGKFINCGFQILDGPIQVEGQPAPTIGSQAGKTAFININFLNENPVAQQIGQERLSALCHAVQVLRISDTTQLHGRPLQMEIGIQANDARYNEVLGFFYENGASIVPQTTGVVPVAAPAAAPAWAGAAVPTPAPAPAPAPAAVPAPVAAPPVAAPTPAPVAAAPIPVAAPAPEPQYFAASGGQNLPGTYTADQVRVLPQGLVNIQVCKVGDSAWSPGTSLQVAAPAPAPIVLAPGGPPMPPWMGQVPPVTQ